MNKFMNYMEKSFAPKMNKISNNIWVVTIKDSINQTMPLIFLGSIFSLLTLPGSIFSIEWWPDFWVLFGWSMGIISIMIAFLIPFNFMEKSRLRHSRIIAAISGLILFFMIITPQLIKDGAVGFSHTAFGSGGMFAAITTGIIVSIIMKLFGKFSFFNEDSALPDFVRAWFDQILPIGTVILFGWLLIYVIGFDLFAAIQTLFSPLQYITETYFGFLIIYLIINVLYSMGISSWILTPITMPLMLGAITANIAGSSYVFTQEFAIAYISIGGTGATLGLVFLLLSSKSKRLKALGKASIVPSIFNINEPVVFGAIAWNPILMVPMWINTFVAITISYLFTKIIHFAAIPKILYQLWYTPYPLSTWIATEGSLSSVILVIIIFAITTLIWYPFFKVYEKQCIKEEIK